MPVKTLLPLCFDCARFRGVKIGEGFVCEAFTSGIPKDIIANVADHHEPYKGDHGLTFVVKQAMDNKRAKKMVRTALGSTIIENLTHVLFARGSIRNN